MNLSQFGVPTRPMTRVHGGFGNRLYRLDTDLGSFAVKEMHLADRRWAYHAEDVFRLEQTAYAAGIPMPEPLAISDELLVHRWIEGDKVPEAPVPPSYAFELGEILARLHALDVDWPHGPSEESPARDWSELAARAAATGQPWADELAAQVDTFLAIADFVETCERPGPVVLTHKDLQPWNLLARDGHPVLLDWELSGRLDLAGELGSSALSIAKGRGLDSIEPGIFRSLLDGYGAAGGVLPPPGPAWFVYTIDGWLGHTRINVVRCLDGVEASTGPELALSQQIADDGIRGLPDMFRRLPELVALLG